MTEEKDEKVLAAYVDKIRIEKEKIENIITATEALEVEQKRRRQLLGGHDVCSTEAMQKQINMMEDRLNDALVKFNTKVTENKKLRDVIARKRRERCLYDEIYSKLERTIQAQSQQMRRQIEQGNKSAELRDQAETSLAIAKKELQESKAALEKDREELCSLRDKLNQDEEKDKERPHSYRLKTTPAFSASAVISTEEEEQCNEDLDDSCETLDAKMEQVMRLSGIDDMDSLIERISGNEERLLSRFQYISEIEAEVARVEDDIINAAKELEKKKSKGLHFQMQHLNEREVAKQNWQKIHEKVQALDRQYESQIELWEKMRTGIEKVHNKLGLITPDILGSDGVSESNVFAYLAEVEKKTTEIFSAIANDCEEDEGTTSPSSVLCRSRNCAISNATLNLNLPSVKDAPADDGDRPFTFDELKSSLQF